MTLQNNFQKILDVQRDNYLKANNHELIKLRMDSYTICYQICTVNQPMKKSGGDQVPPSKELYTRCKELVESYLRERESLCHNKTGDAASIVRSTLCCASTAPTHAGDELRRAVHRLWDCHEWVVKCNCIFFKYLDEYYTQNNGVDPLRTMMLKCFKSVVYDSVRHELRKAVLQEIENERRDVMINRTILRDIVR
eukprot:gene2269-3131_t